ncbi:unnamed protein product, partial [Allacma fusca]
FQTNHCSSVKNFFGRVRIDTVIQASSTRCSGFLL